MKPGDLAIIRCKRDSRLDMKCVLLIERIPRGARLRGATWICLLDGRKHSIPCGWLQEVIDESR